MSDVALPSVDGDATPVPETHTLPEYHNYLEEPFAHSPTVYSWFPSRSAAMRALKGLAQHCPTQIGLALPKGKRASNVPKYYKGSDLRRQLDAKIPAGARVILGGNTEADATFTVFTSFFFFSSGFFSFSPI